jgi:succinate dehydrogenase / fumarate reductase cytochrome b subunit
MISAPSQSRSGPHPIFLWLLSSIGKKTIVALTGIVLLAFVAGHLAGNFTIYLGKDWLNWYAAHLQSLGPVLWIIRLFLLGVLVTHIFFTMLLWHENQAARPKKYIASDPVGTSVFARTMRLSGMVVLAFILFHLAHFTLHLVNPSFAHMEAMLDGHQVHDCYGMVVAGFSSLPVVIIYVVGLFLLTCHLSHGIGSLFQTLGLTNRRLHKTIELVTRAIAWILYFGYISIPLSIITGIVK